MSWTPTTDPNRSWSYAQATEVEASEPLSPLSRLVVGLLCLLMAGGAVVWLAAAAFGIANFVHPGCDSGVCNELPVGDHLVVYGQALIAVLGAIAALGVSVRGFKLLRGNGHSSALLRGLLVTVFFVASWALAFSALPPA